MDATTESIILREHVLAHKDKIAALARQYGVKNVRIFGSVANGNANKDSDIDILVDRDGISGLFEICEIYSKLGEILDHEIDFVISDTVHENKRKGILEGEQIWICA
ncbi:MAG: nucleotidyltransferase domain-containing protein [Coriobacteriales bacterium]|jgi:predicted nucleotidyltransferase|nr:nucleotidyltransferase domain-containing protein [Coriobacteriales bacterium]